VALTLLRGTHRSLVAIPIAKTIAIFIQDHQAICGRYRYVSNKAKNLHQ